MALTFNRNDHRTIWYPNKYVPPKGCDARKQWDEQEASIDEIDPSLEIQRIVDYHRKMMKKSWGSAGDAYLVKEQ